MWGGCVQAYKDFSDKWAYVLDQNMTDAEIASLGEQSYVTLCYVVMLCYVMLCNVIICYVMLCYVMLCVFTLFLMHLICMNVYPLFSFIFVACPDEVVYST